jgi:hypothetical protein
MHRSCVEEMASAAGHAKDSVLDECSMKLSLQRIPLDNAKPDPVTVTICSAPAIAMEGSTPVTLILP